MLSEDSPSPTRPKQNKRTLKPRESDISLDSDGFSNMQSISFDKVVLPKRSLELKISDASSLSLEDDGFPNLESFGSDSGGAEGFVDSKSNASNSGRHTPKKAKSSHSFGITPMKGKPPVDTPTKLAKEALDAQPTPPKPGQAKKTIQKAKAKGKEEAKVAKAKASLEAKVAKAKAKVR